MNGARRRSDSCAVWTATCQRSRATPMQSLGATMRQTIFAYTVARALDEQQDLWMWAPMSLYYDPSRAWRANGLPLHPGAERYYREKGYLR